MHLREDLQKTEIVCFSASVGLAVSHTLTPMYRCKVLPSQSRQSVEKYLADHQRKQPNTLTKADAKFKLF